MGNIRFGFGLSTYEALGQSLLLNNMKGCIYISAGRRTPVTIVATNDTIFLSKENFAHWPLPRIQPLPDREALLPPFLDVEQRGITDVESIVSNVHIMWNLS